MRKNLLLLAMAALLCSCSLESYYQVCKVSSDLATNSEGEYHYKDAKCEITYNFRQDNGVMSFAITNNSNEMMFVDLTESFFIKNGVAFDYFLNRMTSTSSSTTATSSTGATAKAYGYWNLVGTKVPGSVAASAENGVASQRSATVSYQDKPIAAIPPHASKIIAEYSVLRSRFQQCTLVEKPRRNQPSSLTFSQNSSPVLMTNYITYRIGDNPNAEVVQNSFFVSEITNYAESDIIHDDLSGCPNDAVRSKIKVFNRVDPNEFYFIYIPKDQKKSLNSAKRIVKTDDLY